MAANNSESKGSRFFGPMRRWRDAVRDYLHRTDTPKLGDFTATPRMVIISLMSVGIGAFGAVLALGLIRLIGLFTNLFFFQRWSAALISPAGNHLGWLLILVPVGGGIIVGLMARYGSEKIRGHGIPEALEAILIQGSRMEPRLSLLKPLSSAIAIGSGGPFGAEGPIIMTGGAFGSLVAQLFRMTAAERKTLLVAGAAAGMSATFASPVAAVLIEVELLLFEWKPRSLVPVALASATAAVMRPLLLGAGPLFPVPVHPQANGWGILCCLLVGLFAGVLSSLLTALVYAAEDAYRKLPIHWMWWPAIGGLVIGLGGLIFPQALGVGYDVIAETLQNNTSLRVIVGVLIVKSIIWSVSLSSGTSGGVLAPLLMIGGALGGVEALFLPSVGPGFWPLISMAAVLGGTMRSPLTAIVFALELTHDLNALLPLLIAVTVAHAVTVLLMKRSILTEKIARRGLHLSREYSVDPLEILMVKEVMRTKVVALPENFTEENIPSPAVTAGAVGQRLLPIVDSGDRVIGVVTAGDLEKWKADKSAGKRACPLNELIRTPVFAYPDEPLRVVVYRMAETALTRFPVVDPATRRLLGTVSLDALLKARTLNLEAERRRERVLGTRVIRPQSPGNSKAA